jgi:prevent-host-death family protein
MKVASVSEARNRFSALLDLVRSGESVTITDRGRPVARLVPALGQADGDDEARLARLERAGLIRRPTKKLDVEAFLARPLPDLGGGVVELLLQERRRGR